MYSFYNSLILQLCVQTELYKVGTMGYRVCDTRSADLTNHTTEQIISSGTHWWTTGRIVSNPVDWDVSLAYVTCVLYVFCKYARIVSLLDRKISTKITELSWWGSCLCIRRQSIRHCIGVNSVKSLRKPFSFYFFWWDKKISCYQTYRSACEAS